MGCLIINSLVHYIVIGKRHGHFGLTKQRPLLQLFQFRRQPTFSLLRCVIYALSTAVTLKQSVLLISK